MNAVEIMYHKKLAILDAVHDLSPKRPQRYVLPSLCYSTHADAVSAAAGVDSVKCFRQPSMTSTLSNTL